MYTRFHHSAIFDICQSLAVPGDLYENISIYVLKYGYQIQWYHAIYLDHVRVKLHSRRNNHNHMQKYLSHEQ